MSPTTEPVSSRFTMFGGIDTDDVRCSQRGGGEGETRAAETQRKQEKTSWHSARAETESREQSKSDREWRGNREGWRIDSYDLETRRRLGTPEQPPVLIKENYRWEERTARGRAVRTQTRKFSGSSTGRVGERGRGTNGNEVRVRAEEGKREREKSVRVGCKGKRGRAKETGT